MPLPAATGKGLPLSEGDNDLSILSVRESTSGHDIEQTPVATGFQAYVFESNLDTLTNSLLQLLDTLAQLSRPLSSEEENALLGEGGQSEFDPTKRILSEEVQTHFALGELPNEDLFKDTEDCAPKVNEGVAKRVNSACVKRPAKKQFSSIQKKYLRTENCEFLKPSRVNPELRDDLQDKTKSRESSFQSFQRI